MSRAAGPYLYNGSSGIALFLSKYAQKTGSGEARELARASIHGALAALAEEPVPGPRGLHQGALGALLCTQLAATMIGLEDTSAKVISMAKVRVPMLPERSSGCHDVLGGTAGDAIAMLGLARCFQDDELKAASERCGEDLLGAARWDGDAASWPSPGHACRADLTGFSHGTAGIATALLALYSQTGRVAFRDCATAAFRYERRAYSPNLSNWPDYRRIYRHKLTETRFPRTNTAWCHGAAGIALSCMFALEVLSDFDIEKDARLAFGAVRKWMHAIRPPDVDLCLCHGLAGNISILQAATRTHLAENEDHQILETAHSIFAERLSGKALNGWDPGLMTGIAGVGWTLLCSGDNDFPQTPLLPLAEG